MVNATLSKLFFAGALFIACPLLAAPPAGDLGSRSDLVCADQDPQQTNINEVTFSGTGAEYIEFKTLTVTDFSGWQVCYVANNVDPDVCADFATGSGSFKAFPPAGGETLTTLTQDPDKYIVYYFGSPNPNSTYGEVILLDDSGEVVDYIKYCKDTDAAQCETYWSAASGSCMDTVVEHGNSSLKSIGRVEPDGTGDWSENPDKTEGGTNEPTASSIAYFVISHSGTGVTCEAEPVTITAYDAGDNPVIPPAGTGITVTTTPAVDDISGSTAFDGSSASLTLWLTETTATAAVDIDVTDGTATDIDGDAAKDPALAFVDAALRFYADGSASSIGTQIAGKASDIAPGAQTLTLRAVQTNADTGACEARVTGTQTVQLAFSCEDPGTCKTDDGVSISGTPIADNPAAGISDYSAVSLTFDANGSAAFTLNYSDAGQIALHARLALGATATHPATTLTGSSNVFTVKPAGLCVESLDTNADCPSGDASCSAFVPAAIDFNLTVRAVGWESLGESDSDFCSGNSVTPNFQLAGIAIDQNLIAPAGGAPGTLGVTAFDMSDADNGSHTLTQSISEVGVFSFSATPPSYFGETIATSTSDYIGRFYPAYFTTAVANGILANTISSGATPFTYLGETFGYDTAPTVTINAVNTAGGTTLNYRGAFIKLTADEVSLTYPTQDNTQLDEDGNNIGVSAIEGNHAITDQCTLPTPSCGSVLLTLGGVVADQFTYDRSRGQVAPFSADLTLSLTAVNETEDGVGANDLATPRAIDPVGNLQRFGRATLQDNYGRESDALELYLYTQYFDGTAFVSNGDDLTTAYSVQPTDPATPPALTDPSCSDPGSDPIQCGNVAVGGSNIGHGDYFTLAAPGSGNYGVLNYTLGVDSWLRYDWGSGSYIDNPDANATFGIYRGDDRFIYWREVE